MQRLILPERPDWQAKADSLGFTWHHTSGDPYWSDNVAYALTLQEVEEGIEAPTAELHQMCLDLVDEAVKSERLMGLLDIPEKLRDYVADSWKRGDPSLYGRFDFGRGGRVDRCRCGRSPASGRAIERGQWRKWRYRLRIRHQR